MGNDRHQGSRKVVPLQPRMVKVNHGETVQAKGTIELVRSPRVSPSSQKQILLSEICVVYNTHPEPTTDN
jgi:hypothetical protein